MTEEQFTYLTEQILIVRREITALRASVTALQAYAASQMSPGNPVAALEQLYLAAQKILEADSNDQELKKALDTIEALRQWKNQGNPPATS